jgi:hypothetical protein
LTKKFEDSDGDGPESSLDAAASKVDRRMHHQIDVINVDNEEGNGEID